MLQVRREQVLAYRAKAQGLANQRAGDVPAVLDLGVQDTPAGSARLALATRGHDMPDGLVLAWTVRTAPHLHPAGELGRLALALWPLDQADGMAKIGWESKRFASTGMSVDEAITTTAKVMRAEITEPTVKGTASAAVTAKLPPQLKRECRACQSIHVYESLFRLAALAAGIRLEPDAPKVTLVPVDDWPGLPQAQQGERALIHAYLRHLGPARPAEVATWLQTTVTVLRKSWPDDLLEVSVDGRTAWIPPDAEGDLRAATTSEVVRLLPPADPYLQARDRDLLVPDAAARKVLWPSLGAPGAVLAGGEIVGAWRPRASGKRLRLLVMLFGELFPDQRSAVREQAQVIARVRGAAEASVEFS